VARDNAAREELNEAARALQRRQGALGEGHTYGAIDLAVGDRVICRQNDRRRDVDNGMRGTVRHLDEKRVVIDTDGGLVRELPAAYVEEHVEHAYALTGHGMQGGTVEAAVVVASPRDLTAGWSYTALSRARGETRLLIYDDQDSKERTGLAPRDPSPMRSRADLLAPTERRMAQRDDEELAIEQLPGAGRADDTRVATGRALQRQLPQERASLRAEPTSAPTASTARLRASREQIEQLEAQLEALPRRELQRIKDLDARAATLTAQRQALAERLAALPAPRRRFARVQDPDSVERANLTSAIESADRELDATVAQRGRVARELGDPSEIRSEREGLEQALARLGRERGELRDRLAEPLLSRPAAWVRDTFGERPAASLSAEVWEQGVRAAARYRIEHDVADPAAPLGPRPETHAQQRDWEQARGAVERAQRRLGREVSVERGVGLELGP
jgi:hypothetical protein